MEKTKKIQRKMYDFPQPIKLESIDLVLVQCTRQPGRLRVTKRFCAYRYNEAQKLKGNTTSALFDIERILSLKRCQTCPQGRMYSESTR